LVGEEVKVVGSFVGGDVVGTDVGSCEGSDVGGEVGALDGAGVIDDVEQPALKETSLTT
jgi:uncharacterized protein YcfJ